MGTEGPTREPLRMARVVSPRLAGSVTVPSQPCPRALFDLRALAGIAATRAIEQAPVLVQATIERGTQPRSPTKMGTQGDPAEMGTQGPSQPDRTYSTRGPKRGPNLTWRYGLALFSAKVSLRSPREALRPKFEIGSPGNCEMGSADMRLDGT
jgi:hypothetical protein